MSNPNICLVCRRHLECELNIAKNKDQTIICPLGIIKNKQRKTWSIHDTTLKDFDVNKEVLQ